MKIVIIANFPNALDGREAKGRFMYLGEMLAGRGHDVELVVSDFEHGSKQHRDPESIRQGAYRTRINVLHEPGYRKNVSLRRLYSHWVWGRNVGKYLESKAEKPDCVYCAVPSLTASRKAAKYCRKKGSRYIIDIQDIWPEAFELVLPGWAKWVLKPMRWYVDSFYREADRVIAVSDTYRDIGLRPNRKDREGLTVYLGNNGELFDQGREQYRVDRTDDEVWVAYIGSLGYSYDLPCVIEALAIYRERYPDARPVRFVVMGRGPLREKFERLATERGVQCRFTGALPYAEMVGLMCSCDMVVNPINPGAAQSITNKVGDYALSGLPVVNTQENAEYRRLVEQYGCGINCGCGDASQVADAIHRLACDPELRRTMGEGSRRLGVERFDRRTSYRRLVEAVEEQEQKV